MEAVIYYMDMSSNEIFAYRRRYGYTGSLEEVFGSRLSAGRREKIRNFRFEKDRLLSLGAGLLLDYGLRQYGLREREVLVGYKGNQKPYLPEHPGIYWNLSHSGTIAMAAFGSRELGCDVEQIKKADYKVAARFFAEGEREYLESIADKEEKNAAFYRLWTLKESFIKATGEGVRMPLSEFCIHLENAGRVGGGAGNLGSVGSVGTGAGDLGLFGSVGDGTGGQGIYAEAGGRVLPYVFQEYELPGYRAALCMETEEGEELSAVSRPELRKVTLGQMDF